MNTHDPSRTGPVDGKPNSESEELLLEERYQAQISALLDGQLHHDQLLSTIDYLVRTPEAVTLYRNARALEGLLQASGRAAVPERPGAELWRRIERDVSQPDPDAVAPSHGPASSNRSASRTEGPGLGHDSSQFGPDKRPTIMRPLGSALFAVAATALLAYLALTSYRVFQERPQGMSRSEIAWAEGTGSEVRAITVGSRPDQMSDTRFLILAREMLEADRKYRDEMLELMEAVQNQPMVERTTGESEASDVPPSPNRGGWDRNESDPFRDRPTVNFR